MNILTALNVLSALRRLRQHERWTRGQLEAYQAAALHDLRQHAYQHSPFYRRFHRGLMDCPLHELPVLSKAAMMEHFDELVTDPDIRLEDVRAHLAALQGDERYRDRYWVSATSGSTGQPGVFLFNRAEWAAVLASFARSQEWAGLKIDLRRHRKIAVVASTTPHHMSARIGATLQTPWISTLRLSAAERLETRVQALNGWQPEFLIAYASMARILADEQLAGRLKIAPALIFTSSEVLTGETRRRVEAAWGKVLFNEYAATETGGLAAECQQHTGMHLFEDLTIVEVVDERSRPVPPGEYGDRLLITSLFNRTQPLIRYELSDSIRLTDTPCPCGRPFRLIEAIQGREEDTLYFPGADGGEVAVHPNVFHHIMDTVPASGWQVMQDAAGLTLFISGARETFDEAALAAQVRQALAEQGVAAPPIRVQRVPTIPKGPSGKAPLILSKR